MRNNVPERQNAGLEKLGLGCSGAWAQGWFSEKKAIDLVRQAVDSGITTFDTGNFYGGGRAEERLGNALRGLAVEQRAALRISSKTGTQIGPDGRLAKDFSRDTILQDVDTSLVRLGIDALDILYLHGPNEHELTASLPILVELKHAGTIRAIGVCSDGHHLAQAAAEPAVDILMGRFNLLDLSHYETFRTAKAAGKQICAIAPLAQGLYRRSLFFPRSLPDGWYLARALLRNREQLTAAQSQRWVHEIEGWKASDLALGFALASEVTDIVLINTTRSEHLAANIATAARPFPPALYQDILTRAQTT